MQAVFIKPDHQSTIKHNVCTNLLRYICKFAICKVYQRAFQIIFFHFSFFKTWEDLYTNVLGNDQDLSVVHKKSSPSINIKKNECNLGLISLSNQRAHKITRDQHCYYSIIICLFHKFSDKGLILHNSPRQMHRCQF